MMRLHVVSVADVGPLCRVVFLCLKVSWHALLPPYEHFYAVVEAEVKYVAGDDNVCYSSVVNFADGDGDLVGVEKRGFTAALFFSINNCITCIELLISTMPELLKELGPCQQGSRHGRLQKARPLRLPDRILTLQVLLLRRPI